MYNLCPFPHKLIPFKCNISPEFLSRAFPKMELVSKYSTSLTRAFSNFNIIRSPYYQNPRGGIYQFQSLLKRQLCLLRLYACCLPLHFSEERCKPFSSSASFSVLFCQQELWDLHVLVSTYKSILSLFSHFDASLLQFTVNSSFWPISTHRLFLLIISNKVVFCMLISLIQHSFWYSVFYNLLNNTSLPWFFMSINKYVNIISFNFFMNFRSPKTPWALPALPPLILHTPQ